MISTNLGFSLTSTLKKVGTTAIKAQGVVFKTAGVASKIPGVSQGANAILPGSGRIISAGGQIDSIVGDKLLHVGSGSGGTTTATAVDTGDGTDAGMAPAQPRGSKQLIKGVSNKTLFIAGGGLLVLLLVLKR
jgi:hypothetical protein